jgi:hypothetical protein
MPGEAQDINFYKEGSYSTPERMGSTRLARTGEAEYFVQNGLLQWFFVSLG